MTHQDAILHEQARRLADRYFPILITRTGAMVDPRYESFVEDVCEMVKQFNRKETDNEKQRILQIPTT